MLCLPFNDPTIPDKGIVKSSYCLHSKSYEPAGQVHDRISRLIAFRKNVNNINSGEIFPEEDEIDKKEIDFTKLNSKRRKKSITIMRTQDFYEILNLEEDRVLVTEEMIKKNYKKLAILYHPDKHEEGKYDEVAKEQFLKVD